MKPKERAWLCAGHKWEYCDDCPFPDLWVAAGMPAVLLLPRRYEGDDERRELAFGWACAEIAEQRCGWLFVVRRIALFAQQVGKIASALVAGGVVARLM